MVATAADWSEFWGLVQTDRPYLAFCVGPLMMAICQPFVLARVNEGESKALDYVPFVGLLMASLFRGDDHEDE